jgi:phospholipase/carboxylesterase
MSFALGLDARRPRPGGILAFSGFIPTVAGWEPDLPGRAGMRVFIAHGRRDPVIDVALARHASQLLREGGLEVEYHESDVGHQIDPADILPAVTWLQGTIAA